MLPDKLKILRTRAREYSSQLNRVPKLIVIHVDVPLRRRDRTVPGQQSQQAYGHRLASQVSDEGAKPYISGCPKIKMKHKLRGRF